jgi:hypothetical protein
VTVNFRSCRRPSAVWLSRRGQNVGVMCGDDLPARCSITSVMIGWRTPPGAPSSPCNSERSWATAAFRRLVDRWGQGSHPSGCPMRPGVPGESDFLEQIDAQPGRPGIGVGDERYRASFDQGCQCFTFVFQTSR